MPCGRGGYETMPSPNRKPTAAPCSPTPGGPRRDLAAARLCGNIRSPRYPGCCPSAWCAADACTSNCSNLACRVSSAVEQRFCKPLVGSSILSPGTTIAPSPRNSGPSGGVKKPGTCEIGAPGMPLRNPPRQETHCMRAGTIAVQYEASAIHGDRRRSHWCHCAFTPDLRRIAASCQRDVPSSQGERAAFMSSAGITATLTA